MNAVIYCSCTGHCKAVAQKLSARLGYTLTDYTEATDNYSAAVIVFPVHCQSFPPFLKSFFQNVKAECAALIAIYGGARAGNAVYEAKKLIKAPVIAAAYLPSGHSYLNDGFIPDELPEAFIAKICDPSPVYIPRRKKTPFAAFLPSLRSRAVIKILRNGKCVRCNKCGDGCPTGGIINGKTNLKCVRCLKCVASCPRGALEIKKTRVLCRYLEKAKQDETVLYIN